MASEVSYSDWPKSSWPILSLRELIDRGDAELQTGPFGTMLHAKAYRGTGVPVVAVKNIGDNRLLSDDIPRVDDETSLRLERYRLQEGDIVFGRKGAVDRRALVKAEEEGWLQGSDCIRLRLNKRNINPRFVSLVLGSPFHRAWMIQQAQGATMPSLNQEILSRLPLPIPEFDEQQHVATVLGTLDDKIELNRKMNETLEAMARALFKSWFVDFDPVRAKAEGRPTGLSPHIADLFPDSFEDSELGEIPSGWKVQVLSNLCTLGRGASPRPIHEFMEGEIPWIKIADATAASGPFLFETKERIKRAGVQRSIQVVPGDLILSNSATCGVPIFVELHGCIHDGWLYFKGLQQISKQYLFHVLAMLSSHLIHIADGSVQKNLNTNLVGAQRVLVPPPSLIAEFDRQACLWFARIRGNSLESQTLADLRDVLLPKLINGELRVNLGGHGNSSDEKLCHA